ncbi:MAG: metalloprotease family protein [Thermoplasmatota archaeon]
MHPIEPLLLGVLAIVIHEIFHYLPHVFMKTKFKRFIVSTKSIGFQFSNDFMRDKKKMILVNLLPLSLSSILFLDPYNPRIFILVVVNLLWSITDITTIASLVTRSPDERVVWGDTMDQKARDKAIIDIELD